MKKLISIGLVLAVGILWSPAFAEETMSLRDALDAALSENNLLRAKEWSTESLRNDKGIAWSHLLPKITFEERFSRTNNPTYSFMSKLNQKRFEASDFDVNALNNPDAISNFQTAISFEQPLFVKKAYVGIDMAEAAIETSEKELQRMREKVGFDVFQAYVNIIVAREYAEVSRKALEDAREHRRIADLRYRSGLGLYSDVLRADVAVAEAEKAIVQAEKNVKTAKLMLGMLMGRSEPVDAADKEIAIPDRRPIDEYIESAYDRNDLKAVETRYENARNAVRLAEAEYYPMIGVGGSYELDDHNTPFGSEGKSWQVMAFLRINVFDGLNREKTRSKALYQAREAAEYLDGLRNRVNFEVHEAFYAVEEAEKKYELAKAAEQSAEEGVRLVRKRYENSLAPIVSLLDAQTALDTARASVVEAHGNRHSALARLEFVSGRLLQGLAEGQHHGDTTNDYYSMNE